MPGILQDGELILYGFVGENYWDEGFTALEVLNALALHGRDEPITARINSGGGYTDEGIAIFNALKTHKGKVSVIIDAMAASAASIIAMAGDERTMRTGAMMMIHDPAGEKRGTAAEHEAMGELLHKQADLLAGIYADVTGKTPDELRQMMVEETWMNGSEAQVQGFATVDEAAQAVSVSAFDYRTYNCAPDTLKQLSKTRNWSAEPQRSPAASVAQTTVNQEIQPMTTQTAADANSANSTTDQMQSNAADAQTAERERIGKILNCAEAVGRTELAKYLAFETSTSFEDGQKVLDKAAKAGEGNAPKSDGQRTQASTYEQQRLSASSQASSYSNPSDLTDDDKGARLVNRAKSMFGGAK
ncbi:MULTISPECIES: head maturation protease, ClpP-related [unclassified Pseudovibrio]|uniref:head maturation protease, ClpP-related n=1 Tax=unclassified Pseudovibrio TaxID=2627060 RepID=UPI0007AE3E47|nr:MULTISPECIES: head maturation protease, ClpP-related [unclassified Pseudovibrio]KZK95052.1 ATP-dependent Clp protease proteolytic subunit 1 [Pseudovibrio sp. W74]KZL08854.1 ATP-dependent Clp protease proteolytic subunit 1 [Pseudovibrio sp. Ad14]